MAASSQTALEAGAGAANERDATGVIDSAKESVQEADDRVSVAYGVGADRAEAMARNAGFSNAHIMNTVRVIGGAMIGISVLVVVLNEVFSLDSISNSSGPFADVITQLTTIGGAGLGLLVIGILVLAANRVMGFFGGGGM